MHIQGRYILDDQGRVLILRGCNLGGNSKVPKIPPGETWRVDSLDNPQGVSFVGRPFPPEEAEAHFDRLKSWGFTFLRFIVTWEALEHAGPGIYDEAYIAYLRKLLLLAEAKGISVFIDPHQDVWSRWTGGDGAPAWTLEKLGMDLKNLDSLGAALTRQHRKGPFPRMGWPTNYNRYAAATLFTLFFAGNTYAPGTLIEGENAQDWLQERYLACMRHCFRRLKNCKALAGWGTMNEPHPGYIGIRNLEEPENIMIHQGPLPSPLEGMAAASGHPQEVPVYSLGLGKPRIIRRERINPQALSLFREGYGCPWKQAGVWTDQGGPPRLLRPDHFALYRGRPVNFVEDFLNPFMERFIRRIREADPKSMIFIEGLPQGIHPSWSREKAEGVVNAFHWYDGLTLFTKSFRPWFNVETKNGRLILGKKKVAAYYKAELAAAAAWTREHMGDIPCFLGEFGLPFDLKGKKAYKTGDYRLHEEALSRYYDAVDHHLLHSTIWHYSADNTYAHGDGWNDEDLSIYSEDAGGPRAMGGWLRPYPMATAGIPRSIRWDRKKGCFEYRFLADPRITGPTELFAPPECLGAGPLIALEGPGGEEPSLKAEFDPERRRVFITNRGYAGEVTCTIRAAARSGSPLTAGRA